VFNRFIFKNRLLPGLAVLFTLNYASFSQITPGQLQQFITKSKYANNKSINEFYALMQYKTAWIKKEDSNRQATFNNNLKLAADLGLRQEDYQNDLIRSFLNKTDKLQTSDDSLNTEINFTEAALHFYNDIAFGNTKPTFGYDGLNYKPDCMIIPALLAKSISTNALPSLFQQLSGSLPEITTLQNKLIWLNYITSASNFSEVIIASDKTNNANKPLITKLYQLGIMESISTNLPDSILKKKVKEAQMLFGLLTDGVLRSTLLRELNIPLSSRMQQLNLSLNYYRWLNCLIQKQPVIVVNIPAAYMKVYSYNKVILEMRMVVGKQSTPTPTLTSMVNEVILYPYWHVPYSISTKELLPKIKRNPAFINTGNYQVLNQAGNIVDPYSVNWNSLSQSYFPYLIRQSTGCDNALGLLKLNFNNPFSVYLHDTNKKNIFKYNKRYYSHGCMRMEKPMELGHLLLKNNLIAIDTLEQKGCLRNQSPIAVPVSDKMPVIIWYNPAGVDSAGRVEFFEDIYNKFTGIKK
jgi:murein L,D-transpeptidase YcbB/YkuD